MKLNACSSFIIISRISSVILLSVIFCRSASADCAGLLLAAGHGQVSRAEQFLDSGVDPNCVGDDGTGKSRPVIAASVNGELGVLQLLVERGADVNLEAQRSVLPLHSAVMAGQVAVVRYLVDQGVDVNAIIQTYNEEHQRYVPFSALDIAKMYNASPETRAIISAPEMIAILEAAGAKETEFTP